MKKLVSSVIIFLLFIYISIFICKLPGDYTIKRVDGQWTTTHTLAQLVNDSNDKFLELMKFDLGSNRDGRPLDYLATDILKNSLVLMACGLTAAVALGILKGIADSRRGKRGESNLKVLMTIIPVSLPDIFIIALLQKLAIYLSSKGIEIFKVAGSGSINHLFLPVIALSILPACYIARMTSISIEGCYTEDYIKAAIGKGCSKRRILWNHIMRNVLPSVIDSLPTITTILIGNMMMVEYLFAYPGLTQSLMLFFKKGENNGVIADILLLGSIYFLLDMLFRLLKLVAVKRLKEEGI